MKNVAQLVKVCNHLINHESMTWWHFYEKSQSSVDKNDPYLHRKNGAIHLSKKSHGYKLSRNYATGCFNIKIVLFQAHFAINILGVKNLYFFKDHYFTKSSSWSHYEITFRNDLSNLQLPNWQGIAKSPKKYLFM